MKGRDVSNPLDHEEAITRLLKATISTSDSLSKIAKACVSLDYRIGEFENTLKQLTVRIETLERGKLGERRMPAPSVIDFRSL